MQIFVPDRAYVEPGALQYPMGKEILEKLHAMGVEILETTSHNQIRGLPGDTELQKYRNAKRTLVVGVRKTLKFDTSKPSAEYAIPIATGCIGHCHYCYLQTTLGAKPYIRVYVNIEEILQQAQMYIHQRQPEITRFEAACTSDPLSIEHLTGSLRRLIEFMGNQPYGRLRFVTKYHWVDSLLDAKHGGHTRFRFSVNAPYMVKQFEANTSPLSKRIEAACKVVRAGYPLGFIIAPVYLFDGWQDEYTALLEELSRAIPSSYHAQITFEIIQHRFTKPAKRVIEKHYPKTKLHMEETDRQYKWGRYGIGKYVYRDEQQQQIRALFEEKIANLFSGSNIEYFT
ncbi:spore photoproduct lyase [Alicyclobacillus sp. TC]|uniref:spore photoproduct lyase n=1 Tax=Alicyclobacillus sp. TC TaxID=2606450 RepID=UPI001933E790|nr:spore photoproduct lyase [Alicyclobacillus sp. TC]QRF22467.1 spore photoproduct lyase [Alicyclobacillus sp. TC]